MTVGTDSVLFGWLTTFKSVTATPVIGGKRMSSRLQRFRTTGFKRFCGCIDSWHAHSLILGDPSADLAHDAWLAEKRISYNGNTFCGLLGNKQLL